MKLGLPKAADLERSFMTWFWLFVLVLWLGGLFWVGWKAQDALQAQAVNPQLVTAKEERIDQKTLTAVQKLIEARANRSDTTPLSANRFSPGS